MAVARAQGQGGFSAIHVWLIVFVALWLTSTVLLVILYLDQEKSESAVAQMQDEIGKVISSEGRKVPQWAESKAGTGNTTVDLLESARGTTAALVSGNAADQPATLRQGFDTTVAAIQQDPMIQASGVPFAAASYAGALDDMYQRYKAAAQARSEAEAALARLSGEVETLRATQTGQKDEFVAQAEALRNEIVRLRAEYDANREAHEQQVADFEQKLAAREKQCNVDIQQQRERTADLRKDYDQLFARYEQLSEKLGQSQVSPLPLATARVADGQVLSAKPGEDVVYIDLGQRDHLTLGLEFAVYDALEGVPESGNAKARLEVVSIFSETAACRIEQMLKNDYIREGDLVANPVYDRDRKLKFYVLGEFDLNGDGRADPDGAKRIEAMIAANGGVVEDRLTAQVDFVVLGGPPATPKRSMQFTEAEDVQYQSQKKQYDAFQDTLATVQALAVPRLTQSVFLNFMGLTRQPVTVNASVVGAP